MSVPTSITNPSDLLQAFKSSGEFSRIRRDLLNEFQDSEGIATFKARIEDIVKQRLISNQKLKYLPQDAVQRELMQELERFPVIERAVSDLASFSNGSLLANIQASANRMLQVDKSNPRSTLTSIVHVDECAADTVVPESDNNLPTHTTERVQEVHLEKPDKKSMDIVVASTSNDNRVGINPSSVESN